MSPHRTRALTPTHPPRATRWQLPAWAVCAGLAVWLVAAPPSHAATTAPDRIPSGKSVKSVKSAKPTPATRQAKKQRAAPARKKAHVRSDSEPDVVTYGHRDDVMRFGTEVAARQGLDGAWVQAALARSRYVPSVARLIMPPPAGTAKNWAAYRERFIEPKRIAAGVAFWQAHERWLVQAEQIYGVPGEIVVGIVGVETLYGQHLGSYRVIDALATLSFDFPPGRKDRSAFFKDELEQWLVLSHRERQDPVALKGSYAGALGLPQFMPSSVIKYAVDFDGDGHIDLHTNGADVIGSVAHYLAKFGWQRGLPTHLEVAAPTDTRERAALLVPDIVPSFTAQQFSEHGAVFGSEAELARIGGTAGNTPLALVELQNGEAAPSHVAGTANFYAVTRYNWSSYYAMAVIELGAAVRRAR